MPPKILAKNADRTGGVLPVNAATRASASKGSSSIRLKLEVRRLPPGLTLTEFEETLGEEWKLGIGKVDWREYRQGKTRAPGSGKVPEQSRCYIHVVSEPVVKEFERRFLEVVFQDKAGTHRNPELKNLQPTLGFAPNQRTPLQQAKQRTDNRQGTIDQDPEFIVFLESETQPIAKPAALDTLGADKDGERKEVKTTPLIEDLRERKANKAKAALAKAEKAEKDKKATKGSAKEAAATTGKDGGKGSQQKVEQAAKDAAKALNKQAATKQQQQATAKTASPTKAKKPAPTPKQQAGTSASAQDASTAKSASPAAQRNPSAQRQRGNTDGIKKMLQKDLGIKPKASPPVPSPAPSASTPPTTSPVPVAAAPANSKPTSPVSRAATTTSPAPSTSEPKSPPVKAYLKHANPSQGMTEILIQQALAQYGEVANVTIDPRKGTAIAVFKEPDALKKALEAKRVPVANGAIEVLEFRDRAATGSSQRGGFRGGRGGRGGARGGAQGAAAASTAAAGSAAATAPSQAS